MGPEMASAFVNPGEFPWMLADLMQIDTRFLNDKVGVQEAMQNLQNQVSQQQDAEQQQAQQQGQPQEQMG